MQARIDVPVSFLRKRKHTACFKQVRIYQVGHRLDLHT